VVLYNVDLVPTNFLDKLEFTHDLLVGYPPKFHELNQLHIDSGAVNMKLINMKLSKSLICAATALTKLLIFYFDQPHLRDADRNLVIYQRCEFGISLTNNKELPIKSWH